ncbi:hypothetical protein ACWEU6_07045 [Streptosporangium sandarakinum]|uniref:hypothetical protein n=1 Tax=Streptosporangium sandarakinum TaxID=1260955 RepID=UPI003683644A
MTPRRIAARLNHLEPRAEELATRITQEQGRQLAEVISRTLDELQSRVTDTLTREGDNVAAQQIRQQWPGWVSEIVPAQIKAVTGEGDGRD